MTHHPRHSRHYRSLGAKLGLAAAAILLVGSCTQKEADFFFGVGQFGLAFNPLIGGLDPVIVGSLVDTQGGGDADGLGAFGSNLVVTTVQIIPEPSRAMLLLVGAVGLVARRRRA